MDNSAANTDSTRRAKHSLRINFTWMMASGVANAAFQFATLILIAQLTSIEVLGDYSLALAIVTPILLFFGLQLRGVQATDAANQFSFSSYIHLRLIGVALSLATILGVCAFIDGWPMRWILLATACFRCIEFLADVYYGNLQRNERMHLIGQSTLLRNSIMFIILLACLALHINLSLGLLLSAAFGFIAHRIIDTPSVRNPVDNYDLAETNEAGRGLTLWRLTALSLPLGITMILVSLESSIPRFVLAASFDSATLGVFAGIAYAAIAGRTILVAFGQAISPRMAHSFATRNMHSFGQLSMQLLLLALSLGLLGLLAAHFVGPQILVLILGLDFMDRNGELMILMTAACLSLIASALGYCLTAARRFAVQAPLYGGTVLVLFLASIWLIPIKGVIGAGLAMIMSSAFQIGAASFVVIHSIGNLRRV